MDFKDKQDSVCTFIFGNIKPNSLYQNAKLSYHAHPFSNHDLSVDALQQHPVGLAATITTVPDYKDVDDENSPFGPTRVMGYNAVPRGNRPTATLFTPIGRQVLEQPKFTLVDPVMINGGGDQETQRNKLDPAVQKKRDRRKKAHEKNTIEVTDGPGWFGNLGVDEIIDMIEGPTSKTLQKPKMAGKKKQRKGRDENCVVDDEEIDVDIVLDTEIPVSSSDTGVQPTQQPSIRILNPFLNDDVDKMTVEQKQKKWFAPLNPGNRAKEAKTGGALLEANKAEWTRLTDNWNAFLKATAPVQQKSVEGGKKDSGNRKRRN